ncbi:MAG: hypothetical protein M1826_001281 [Phylliscum demangeonii]|nr:MAG: hypothetical protein M1826_001281 [Phylliscum demangeonii]
MAFGSQRLRAIRFPLLLFVVSLMTALATAAPVLEKLHLGQRVSSFLNPDRRAFQGRGRLRHDDTKAVAVFDSHRTADGKRAVLRTTRNAQCAVDSYPLPPVLDCSTSLGPGSQEIGPIVGDRIQMVWSTFTPWEAAAMHGRYRQKAYISFVRREITSYRLMLRWEPVY